jgi:hypothetical protein
MSSAHGEGQSTSKCKQKKGPYRTEPAEHTGMLVEHMAAQCTRAHVTAGLPRNAFHTAMRGHSTKGANPAAKDCCNSAPHIPANEIKNIQHALVLEGILLL